MATITVIGGGLGGLASALRLAKLGHTVTLLERSASLGGVMQTASKDGYTWDLGPTSTLLPAVLRDLFRKSGRPIDHEVDLVPVDPAREHRFLDGSQVTVPGGSRVDQVAAFDILGAGLGQVWNNYVTTYAETWDLLRRDFLERPYDDALASPDLRRLLASHESLDSRIRTTLKDPRLRAVAAFPVLLEGHDPRRVPAWVGVDAYLCQRFGAWTVPGGFAALTQSLADRLTTRGVTVLTNTTAHDLIVRRGSVAAISTSRGELACDAAVCAIDPTQLAALRHYVGRVRSTTHPTTCHVAVSGQSVSSHSETVFDGYPLLIMRTHEHAGESTTLSLLMRGPGDPLAVLAARGLDLRARVLARLEQAPMAGTAGGSAYGVEWRGRGTVRRRLGPTTPIAGVYAAGAHANPGAGVPWVGLSAALVAQSIGPA